MNMKINARGEKNKKIETERDGEIVKGRPSDCRGSVSAVHRGPTQIGGQGSDPVKLPNITELIK